MNKCVVGWEKTRTKLKFVHVKNNEKLYIYLYPQRLGLNCVIQALELQGCMFPGSLLPHLDKDKWKCTLFTNKPLYFSYSFCQNHTYIKML